MIYIDPQQGRFYSQLGIGDSIYVVYIHYVLGLFWVGSALAALLVIPRGYVK